jgi:hypothetical protein
MAIDPKKIEGWKMLAGRVSRSFFHDIEQNDPDDLAEAVSTLLVEREEMLALLREIQWADNSDGEYTPECPCCGGTNPDRPVRYSPTGRRGTGHMSDCLLAAFLGAKP